MKNSPDTINRADLKRGVTISARGLDAGLAAAIERRPASWSAEKLSGAVELHRRFALTFGFGAKWARSVSRFPRSRRALKPFKKVKTV